MIPREILKKIRPIELRTNRIVNETLAGALLQPPAQFYRISGTVPNGGDNYFRSLFFDDEVDRIRPRWGNRCLACQSAGEAESFGIFAHMFEEGLQIVGESLAQSWLAVIVEINGSRNYHAKAHCFARNLFSMSATTSSSGRHRSGCARARSARRSSSAICSSVSSSSNPPNSRSIASTSSRRSASGIRRNSSRISALLMGTTYRAAAPVQAMFSRVIYLPFVIRHSLSPAL